MTVIDKTNEMVAVQVGLGADFRRLLANAMLFVGNDSRHPTISRVQLEVTAGQLKVASTDSFMLYFETTALEGGEYPDFSFGIDAREIKSVLSGWKSGETAAVEITGTVTAPRVVITRFAQVVTLTGIVHNFPNYSQLVPEYDTVGVARVGFDPFKLAKLAKVDGGDGASSTKKTTRMTCEFADTSKPARFVIGTSTVLLMPVKLDQ